MNKISCVVELCVIFLLFREINWINEIILFLMLIWCMRVIYQIHDFCVNNFHYHNVADDDYHSCSHYQTSATAYEAVAAKLVHNSNED